MCGISRIHSQVAKYNFSLYHINENSIKININELSPEGWTLSDTKTQALLSKIRSKGIPPGDYVNGKIYRGVVTCLTEEEIQIIQLVAFFQ